MSIELSSFSEHNVQLSPEREWHEEHTVVEYGADSHTTNLYENVSYMSMYYDTWARSGAWCMSWVHESGCYVSWAYMTAECMSYSHKNKHRIILLQLNISMGTMSHKKEAYAIRVGKFDMYMFYLSKNADYSVVKLNLCRWDNVPLFKLGLPTIKPFNLLIS